MCQNSIKAEYICRSIRIFGPREIVVILIFRHHYDVGENGAVRCGEAGIFVVIGFEIGLQEPSREERGPNSGASVYIIVNIGFLTWSGMKDDQSVVIREIDQWRAQRH